MKRSPTHSSYIWQRPDWPRFRWDAETLLVPLGRLSHLHGLLQGRMSALGFENKTRSALVSMTQDLVGSSEMEGVTLNPQSVRSSLARRLGIEEDGFLAEDHYVEGLVDVMMDAVRNCRTPLSAERLFDWHAALFPTGRSGMHRISVASWRNGDEPMQVVSGAIGHERVHYEAPPSKLVPSEMERLMEWCNGADESPFILAALTHLWFVTIHPFDDGNGRLSRTLADMMLARLEENGARYYSMSAEINRRKRDYYDILERTQKGDLEITAWMLWFFECLEAAIRRALATLDRTLQKGAYWDRHRDVEVNERQRKVLNRLWDGFDGKLTSSKWAKICRCSQDTALRDIQGLLSKGLLRQSPEAGRSTHYLLPDEPC